MEPLSSLQHQQTAQIALQASIVIKWVLPQLSLLIRIASLAIIVSSKQLSPIQMMAQLERFAIQVNTVFLVLHQWQVALPDLMNRDSEIQIQTVRPVQLDISVQLVQLSPSHVLYQIIALLAQVLLLSAQMAPIMM